jgi:hypothetical protein
MSKRRRTLGRRDQEPTEFSGILMRLCDNGGVLGASLVDRQGETVDYAGHAEPFALRIMAAEWRIVLDQVRSISQAGFDATHELRVRAQRKSFALVALAHGYALVLELPTYGFQYSRRALAEATRAIEREASLDSLNPDASHWSRVEVRTARGDRRRPEAVWRDGAFCPLTILGRYIDPLVAGKPRPRRKGGGEVGYRARLPSGLEFTLIREPTGVWFAGDL